MTIRVLGFETRYIKNENTGQTKSIDWVEIAPAGEDFERTRTWVRVKDKMPPDTDKQGNVLTPRDKQAATYQAMQAQWNAIGPAYEAWKSGQQLPETGTPLGAWPGVTGDQAGYLKKLGVRTVEDVAEMQPDVAVGLPFPNSRRLPELARTFLDGQDAAAKEAENAALRERLAALEEALQAQIDDKPKRGRPKKEEAEAA